MSTSGVCGRARAAVERPLDRLHALLARRKDLPGLLQCLGTS